MELYIAVTKVDKFNQTQSGDTVETIERPNGGISAVLADGRINGKSNKAISTMVSHRVIGNISQGVRDGAAIRAVSSRLFAEHNGTVQANLNVVSADLQTDTILVSRNSPVPVFLISDGRVDCLSAECEPIGLSADVLPSIVELPIRPNMAVIVFSDGVFNAGLERSQNLDLCTTIEALIEEEDPTAQELADYLLQQSIRLDDSFPKDDMSIIVMLISPQSTDNVRHMNVSMSL